MAVWTKQLEGGYGIYFASNPFRSAEYGKYMLQVTIPANRIVPGYHYPCLSNTFITETNADLIMNPSQAIIYNWDRVTPAMVIRDWNFIQLDETNIVKSIHVFNFEDFTSPNTSFANHLLCVPVPEICSEEAFFDTYSDYKPFFSQLSSFFSSSMNETETLALAFYTEMMMKEKSLKLDEAMDCMIVISRGHVPLVTTSR
jgi:hypothetical protein